VNETVQTPLQQHEFDALVSFHFNTGGIYKASGTGLLNSGNKKEAWDRSYSKWNKGTINGRKVTLRGLVTRRAKEKDLFYNGRYELDPIPVIAVNSSNKPVYSNVVDKVTFEEFKKYYGDVENHYAEDDNDWIEMLFRFLEGLFKKGKNNA